MNTACLAPNGMSVFGGDAAPERLLVGTAQGVAVFGRTPGGDWKLATTPLEGKHISSLLLEPVHGHVFAGIHHGGVFFSADNGNTWEERSDGLTLGHVYSLVYSVENGRPYVYAGTEPPSLFRSTDEGRSWEEMPGWRDMPGKDKWVFPMPPHIPHTKTLAVDPRNPKTIFVGCEQAGLFRTDDGGATWRELDSYSLPTDRSYRDIHQIALRPNHPDEIYMTTGMGCYRTENGGEDWVNLTNRDGFPIGYPDRVIFSPLDDRTLYMCGAATVPGKWIRSHRANATVLVSHDRGETWEPASAGMPDPMTANLEAMSLYAWPGGFHLFVGATNGNIYSSEDGGARWRLIGDIAPVSKVDHYRLLLPGAVSQRQPAAQAH